MTEPVAPSASSPERLLGNRYRLGPRVGRGGMATIHRATDLRTGREVAVKLLHPEVGRDPDLAQRFRREALAATVLRHRNIVACLDTGTDGAQAYLVMELIDGEDLAARLRRGGRLAPLRAARIGLDVARALAVAHVRGIVHRDVKPGNILLAEDGRAMVTDFGIARLAADAEAALPGTTLGSVHYFSPEQARGATTTPASDVYGLGLVLYEALTGVRAWTGATSDEIALVRLGAPAPSPRAARPEVPPALDEIVRRALAPAAGDRYRSGQEMADALEPVVAAGERADSAVAASMTAAHEAGRIRTGREEIAAADGRAGPGDGRQAGSRPGVASPSRDGVRRRGPRRLDRSARPPAAVVLAVIAAVGVVGGALLVAFVPGRVAGEPPTDPRGVAEVSTAPTRAPATANPTVAATPAPTPAATEALTSQAAPTAVPAGDVADLCEIFFDIPCGLGPGRYAPSRFETPFDIELGEGWSAADHDRDLVRLVRPEGAMVVAGTVREVYPEGRAREPGPRARDIVEAFLATDGVGATRPADVRLDGRRGRSTDLTPLDDDEAVTLFATDGAPYRLEPGRTTRVVVLDVRDAIVVLVIEPTDGGRLRDLLDVADPAAGTIRWR